MAIGPNASASADTRAASHDTVSSRLQRAFRLLTRRRRERARVWTNPMLLLAASAACLAPVLFAVDHRAALAGRAVPDGTRLVLDYVTDVGLIAWYFYPALLLTIALLLAPAPVPGPARLKRRHLAVHAAFATVGLGAATTITHLLKWLLGRARPPLLEEEGVTGFSLLRVGDTFESFPSGHSNNMGAVAVILAIWFPRWRLFFLAGGIALAATRIAVEAHFPSDVAAGFAIGSLTVLALGRFLALRRIVYRLEDGGEGWHGLFPRRPAVARPRVRHRTAAPRGHRNP